MIGNYLKIKIRNIGQKKYVAVGNPKLHKKTVVTRLTKRNDTYVHGNEASLALRNKIKESGQLCEQNIASKDFW